MRTVTAQEIARRAATSTEQAVEVGASVLGAAIDVMREELTQGNRIVLPNLVSLQLNPSGELTTDFEVGVAFGNSQPPPVESLGGFGIEADTLEPAETGQATIVIPALVQPDVPAALGRQVAAEPAPALRTAAETQGRNRVLFAVPIRDMFTNIIAQRLQGPDRSVTVVEGAQRAAQALKENQPDLVVLDGNLPDFSGMVREVKLGRRRGLIATVVVYPEGVDVGRVDGIRICEDESLQEPFDVGDLAKLVDGELSRIAEERNFFEQEVHFQFQTAEEHIEHANDLVAGLIDGSQMDEEKAAALAVAFREAVDNAARHGNKSQESRAIDVIYLLDGQKVTITVEDEGEGFDTELYLTRGIEGNAVAAARERNRAGRVGGLGIMLMLKCLDDLEYNYVGNLVKLTKYR